MLELFVSNEHKEPKEGFNSGHYINVSLQILVQLSLDK